MSYSPIFEAISIALAPDPYITIDEWADRYRQLPKGASAEAGQYSTDRMPYLREIMQELSPQSKTQQVKVRKGTQLGLSEIGNNLVMYFMDIVPTSQLMILPSETLARKHHNMKIDPSLKAMPSLASKIQTGKAKTDIGATFEKIYPGGSLTIAWSGSSANYRSLSCRVVVMDDVDGFSKNINGEGDVLELGKKRADSFGNLRKIYINSTPTDKKTSLIEKEFLDSDQRYYYMPCPYCKEIFTFTKDLFKFDYDKETYQLTSDVKAECPHCQKLIDEHYKPWMMDQENGADWIAHNPGHIYRGYHVPSYLSPIGFIGWNEIFREYLTALKELDGGYDGKMITWVNTRDAMPWEATHDTTDAQDILLLKNDVDHGVVPPDTAALVMAVDVQQDHFWFKVQALKYGAGKHTMRYGRVETWASLEEILYTQYFDAQNNLFMIALCAVDSGFKRDEVYEFCAMNSDKCIPIKGASGKPTSPWRVTPIERDIGGVKVTTGLKLYLLDTEYFKDMLNAQVNRSILCAKEGEKAKENLFSTHAKTDEGYAKQMTSEYKHCEINEKTGVEKWEWRKVTTKADNHLWDCGVYCTFLGELLNIRFLQRESIQTPRKAQRTTSTDDFMANY